MTKVTTFTLARWTNGVSSFLLIKLECAWAQCFQAWCCRILSTICKLYWPYSQWSFPPFSSKQHDVPHPLNLPTHSSSFRRQPSRQSSLRVVRRHTSNLRSRATTIKKRRRTSATQPPAFPISGALSVVQLARGRPYNWRSGYKPPSKSYFRRHFDNSSAPYALTCISNHLGFSTWYSLWSLKYLIIPIMLFIRCRPHAPIFPRSFLIHLLQDIHMAMVKDTTKPARRICRIME